jgi:integrase
LTGLKALFYASLPNRKTAKILGLISQPVNEGGMFMTKDQFNLLIEAIKFDKIDLSDVQEKVVMAKRQMALSLHKYKIWEGKNGKWYTYLPEEGGRVLKKRTSEADIQDLIVEFYMSQQEEPTIKSIFKDWIKEKLEFKEISKATYDRYLNDYKRFFGDSEIEKEKIKNITEDDLEVFIRKTIAEHELTQKAFSNLRILILGIFKYAKKKKHTYISISAFMGDLEISSKVFKKSIKRRESQVYMEDEIPKVLDYLEANPTIHNLGILLTFQTGLRSGELSALKPSDIIGNTIRIQRQEIRYKDESGKSIREVVDYAKTDAGIRDVIIDEDVLETIKKIRRLNPFGEFLFEKKGKRISGPSFYRHVKNMCNELNIEVKSMHKIRRTYGTMLIDGGVNDSVVKEQMGHADINTTRKHYYYSNKNQKTKEEQIKNARNKCIAR